MTGLDLAFPSSFDALFVAMFSIAYSKGSELTPMILQIQYLF